MGEIRGMFLACASGVPGSPRRLFSSNSLAGVVEGPHGRDVGNHTLPTFKACATAQPSSFVPLEVGTMDVVVPRWTMAEAWVKQRAYRGRRGGGTVVGSGGSRGGRGAREQLCVPEPGPCPTGVASSGPQVAVPEPLGRRSLSRLRASGMFRRLVPTVEPVGWFRSLVPSAGSTQLNPSVAFDC